MNTVRNVAYWTAIVMLSIMGVVVIGNCLLGITWEEFMNMLGVM